MSVAGLSNVLIDDSGRSYFDLGEPGSMESAVRMDALSKQGNKLLERLVPPNQYKEWAEQIREMDRRESLFMVEYEINSAEEILIHQEIPEWGYGFIAGVFAHLESYCDRAYEEGGWTFGELASSAPRVFDHHMRENFPTLLRVFQGLFRNTIAIRESMFGADPDAYSIIGTRLHLDQCTPEEIALRQEVDQDFKEWEEKQQAKFDALAEPIKKQILELRERNESLKNELRANWAKLRELEPQEP